MTTALKAQRAGTDVFVRVHQQAVDATAANLIAAQARDVGVRVPRLLAGPYLIAGRQAWIWEHLDTKPGAATSAEDTAEQLARLHLHVRGEGSVRDVVSHRVAVITA